MPFDKSDECATDPSVMCGPFHTSSEMRNDTLLTSSSTKDQNQSERGHDGQENQEEIQSEQGFNPIGSRGEGSRGEESGEPPDRWWEVID